MLAVAYVKATGVKMLAKAFEGPEARIAIPAALLGIVAFLLLRSYSFIAALLAVGAPLSAVMTFWLPLWTQRCFDHKRHLGMGICSWKNHGGGGDRAFGGAVTMILLARSLQIRCAKTVRRGC